MAEKIENNFVVKKVDDNLIEVRVNHLFDREENVENYDQQTNSIIEEINKILQDNPEETFNIIGIITDGKLSRTLGSATGNVQQLFTNNRIKKIGIVVNNDGAITLMNVLSSMLKRDVTIKFFAEEPQAKSWIQTPVEK